MMDDEEEGHNIAGQWHLDHFRPADDAAKAWCQQNMRPWEHVTLNVRRARSERSHKHKFAWLRDAWLSLPEKYKAHRWAASPDHLRKYALIRTGFYDVMTIPADDPDEATRWASVIQQIDDQRDKEVSGSAAFSIVVSRGDLVYRYTAQSQKMKAMGKDRYQKSKTSIMTFIADLIGVHPEELAQMGRKRRD